MKSTRQIFLCGMLAAAVMAVAPSARAQIQTTGTPGSPGATTTIDGRYLPPPPQPFHGDIQPNAYESKPYWPELVTPPKGAPNILLIMTDDVGFSAPSTFGGLIPTPALDRVAQIGLRYTRFHTTALCSPTRAALLTGRNHHSVATGVVVDQATGYPGYNSVIPRDAVAIGEILRQNGYATSWFGKDHNTPQWSGSQAGPFTDWPNGPIKGFDYYYGFIGDDTTQWTPGNLFRNTTPIQPYLGHPGWNLITAMADEAIQHINMLNEVQPDRPFMVYYAPGATHAPHHPTPEWIKKISDMHLFDKGYEAVRQQIFANQKKLGVIPQDAQLTAWPATIPKWDTLSDDAKKLYIREADVYAAFLAYTDYEIGRVIQAVQDAGKLDNTLIIYISGDNGASPEGTLNGTYSEYADLNGVHPSVEMNMKFYDAWGTNETYCHYAVGWAWTFDTPYQWTKEVASFFGGTRNGMAMAWPARIKDKGGIRNQFHHVIDIVPTILEAARVKQPKVVDGIKQSPIEGVSMAYTFDAKNAKAPSTRKTQYFEMIGDHAIYHDGWIASTKVMRPPWDISGGVGADPAKYPWEIYDLRNDWTQFDDVAKKYPAKLKELQTIFWQEAEKYQVLPLDSTVVTRLITSRPSITAGRNVFTWTAPLTGTPNGDAPSVLNASYNFKAEVEIPQGGAEGMLITQGGRFAGYGFYVLKGNPVFLWNMVDLERIKWEGPEVLTPGKHVLEFDFKYDGLGMATLAFNNMSGIGRSGTGVLKVDRKEVARQTMERTLPFILQWDENLDVGSDTGSPVDDRDYQVPFAFTGKINKITLTIDRPQLTPADEQKLRAAQRNNRASE